METYNADAQVGESSACATALMCGVKANFETVGLDAKARFENCASTYASRVPSLLTWAQQEGKATGVVTNTRLTHATPAALFAHAASRYWEDDGKVPSSSRRVCKDIARQLVEDEPGRSVNNKVTLRVRVKERSVLTRLMALQGRTETRLDLRRY
ncbi:Alkaline phosphatase, tissue-nonspecific isozyme [Frankliniella fusca]|uniref:alkaline phosphatase n=1 Tax=Frankliniella fusca TaxID=407009 RepID=A0AAE1LNF2_9NEOP|nr:Alkaline phosphatase, tissue-nonspecific isozyme [Frankliniella fusca]